MISCSKTDPWLKTGGRRQQFSREQLKYSRYASIKLESRKWAWDTVVLFILWTSWGKSDLFWIQFVGMSNVIGLDFFQVISLAPGPSILSESHYDSNYSPNNIIWQWINWLKSCSKGKCHRHFLVLLVLFPIFPVWKQIIQIAEKECHFCRHVGSLLPQLKKNSCRNS